MAENITQDSKQALKRLNVLVGEWKSEGQTIANGNEPVIKIKGTDTYEWLPGQFFLIHRVDVTMGDQKADVIEIIGGYDAVIQTYPMRSYDNQGKVGLMQATVSSEGVWTFAGESERATLKIGTDGDTMTAHWEQTKDGSKWLPWMDMTFTKVK